MGMYTEIYVNVDLKKETPKEIIDILRHLCAEDSTKEAEEFADKFGERFCCLFHNMSYYTPYTQCGKVTYDEITEQYSLIGKGDIKDYWGDIDKFFEWIAPYVDGIEEFVGYERYEESLVPTLFYVVEGKVIKQTPSEPTQRIS